MKKRQNNEYDLKADHRVFKHIIAEASKLRWRKLNDYGASYRNFGTLGVVIRLSDKIARMVRLIKNAHAYNESLRDTAIDVINYSAMLVLLLDEKKGNAK